jgi:hypothetical protein
MDYYIFKRAIERKRERDRKREGERTMAFLPDGMAEDVAKSETWVKRDNVRDGIYIFGHMRTGYEKTQKGPALIIEHMIVDAKKVKADVEPNPIGSIVSYFMPDYGEAAVMLKPNFKGYICGMLGLDPKKVNNTDPKFVETIKLIGGERQLACGMLIQGTTFHTDTRAGEDFLGLNWTPVAGENDPNAPSVQKRRGEYLAMLAASPQQQPAQQAAAGGAPPSIPGAGAPPAIPGVGDPLAAATAKGWLPHKDNPQWWWNPNLPQGQNLKPLTDIQAGKF